MEQMTADKNQLAESVKQLTTKVNQLAEKEKQVRGEVCK
jgi:X-X-X-Leu-X-X-Gly heptad repeat protein